MTKTVADAATILNVLAVTHLIHHAKIYPCLITLPDWGNRLIMALVFAATTSLVTIADVENAVKAAIDDLAKAAVL